MLSQIASNLDLCRFKKKNIYINGLLCLGNDGDFRRFSLYDKESEKPSGISGSDRLN